MNKKHINIYSLTFKQKDLETKYQANRGPQIQVLYIYSIAFFTVLSILIFLNYLESGQQSEQIWIFVSIFAFLIISLSWLFYFNGKYFLLYHLLINLLIQFGQLGLNYLFFFRFKQSENDPVQQNLSAQDLFQFFIAHEVIFYMQALSIDSSYFLLDVLIIIINRALLGSIFGRLIGQNTQTMLIFIFFPLSIIINRYFREKMERLKFLENNKNSQWTNIIDSLVNSSLIISKWDSRLCTIELVKQIGINISKQIISSNEQMKEFYNKIKIDKLSCNIYIQQYNLLIQGRDLTLKDYLIRRCLHFDEIKIKKRRFIQASQEHIRRKRGKSSSERPDNESIIGYYYGEQESMQYTQIFRIRISDFQLNELVTVVSLEDISYIDDIKSIQINKKVSDNLLLTTLNHLRVKLVPIIEGIQQFSLENSTNNINNSDEIVENIKFNTYQIINHIYTIFDFFTLNEKKGIQVKMAQFSLKSMIWELVSMFQVQSKLKSIHFIHKNDVRRLDKTFSDERRIKQILITLLSSAINEMKKGKITFSISLDKINKDKKEGNSGAENYSPASKSHPSLKFEIEIQNIEKEELIDEKNTAQMFTNIENQVIEETVKTLGPYALKKEQIQLNTYKIVFSIYADFVNLRREERLNSLIRPGTSEQFKQSDENMAKKSPFYSRGGNINECSNQNTNNCEQNDELLKESQKSLKPDIVETY